VSDLTEALLDRKLEVERKANLVEEGLDLVTVSRHKPFVIACIPAYHEEASIAKVLLGVRSYVDEVVVCDDGSNDSTGDIAEALGAKLIRHKSNRGKGVALRDLFLAAIRSEADVVVTIDADGQHHPEDVPMLVKPILEGKADVVVGSRFVSGGKTDAPFYRRVGLEFFNGSGKNDVRDTQSGLRAFSSKALGVVVHAEADGFGVETEQLTLAKRYGLRVLEVPVEILYNGVGKTSKMNPILHGAEILGTMLRLVTEERPLAFFGIPAFVCVFVAFYSGLLLLIEYNNTRIFNLPYAFVFITGFTVGGLLGIAGIVLYAISRVGKRHINVE
jgi:glycosyltransferase involved in cell wall biosynthesis